MEPEKKLEEDKLQLRQYEMKNQVLKMSPRGWIWSAELHCRTIFKNKNVAQRQTFQWTGHVIHTGKAPNLDQVLNILVTHLSIPLLLDLLWPAVAKAMEACVMHFAAGARIFH